MTGEIELFEDTFLKTFGKLPKNNKEHFKAAYEAWAESQDKYIWGQISFDERQKLWDSYVRAREQYLADTPWIEQDAAS
jgi:hypothetical protein